MHSITVLLMCLMPSILALPGENNSSGDYTINTNIPPNSTDITPISTIIAPRSTYIAAITTDFPPISTNITVSTTNISPITTDVAPISTNSSPITKDIPLITTDIAPVTNQTFHLNITDDCAKEEKLVKFLEDYTTNITVLEEEFDRGLYETFNNLSTLLSEGTTKYDALTIKLLEKYSGDANNFMITCKYIQIYSVCSETLQKSLVTYQIPQWREHLDFGITLLNNFKTYINYSQGSFTKRNETVNQFIKLYKAWQQRRHLEKQLYQQVLTLSVESTPEEFMKVLNLERKIIETISDVIDCINNLENIDANDRLYNQTIPFELTGNMEIEKWNISQNEWKRVLSADELLYERKSIADSLKFLSDKLHPTILGILFVIGTLENSVLILVFILNKDMRTPPNFPLINLTIADIFTLAINGLLFIFKIKNAWTFGYKLCEFYNFCENFGITLCMYSVVLVSFQRFLAITNCCKWDISKHFLPKKLTPYIPIAIIWIISGFISSINLWFIDHNTALEYQLCSVQVSKEYVEIIWYSLIIFIGIVPLVTIAATSTITSYHMRRSIKNMPGEAQGLKTAVKARALSSRIILALTVVFIISHFPFFAIIVYTRIFLYQPEKSVHAMFIFTYAAVLTHAMKLLNPCFNPIALYLMSRKYRLHMNKYLTCGLASRFRMSGHSRTTECQDISS